MPAFTFEKLSAPTESGAATPPVEKPRGTLGQLLDRVSVVRIKRSMRQDKRPEASQTEVSE
jgi:hypothetical protein